MSNTPIPHNLEIASDLHAGLVALCDHLRPHGVRDLVYGYMLRDRSFVRNDLIFKVTLSDALMDLYYQDGGLNADPMADQMAAMTEPTRMHLKDAAVRVSEEGVFHFKFAPAAIAEGYSHILTCPVGEAEPLGIGGMTFYQESRTPAPKIDSALVWAAAIEFHKTMKKHGQLAGEFGLDESEQHAISAMARGETASDIADSRGVTRRTVENRLQSVRQKLKAKTTTEAVYKAVAYGVLPSAHSD